MITVGVVAHVKGDGAGAPGDIERLFGIHGQRGHAALVVLRLHELAVADGNIVRRLHLNTLPALLHGGRRHIVVLTLPRVDAP